MEDKWLECALNGSRNFHLQRAAYIRKLEVEIAELRKQLEAK